mmetsp:Transcript_1825/g.5046  ORF Transcript_1825/g.5046 Transcript_1825/m.5046 type:complete len:218 (-) Transcript_1825:280-933(-)
MAATAPAGMEDLFRGVQLVRRYREVHLEAQGALEALSVALPRVKAAAQMRTERGRGREGAALSGILGTLDPSILDEVQRFMAGGPADIGGRKEAEEVLDGLAVLLDFRSKATATLTELQALKAPRSNAVPRTGGEEVEVGPGALRVHEGLLLLSAAISMLTRDLEMCCAVCREACIDTFGFDLDTCKTYMELQPFIDEALLDRLCEFSPSDTAADSM